jgi:hypothetical protein
LGDKVGRKEFAASAYTCSWLFSHEGLVHPWTLLVSESHEARERQPQGKMQKDIGNNKQMDRQM